MPPDTSSFNHKLGSVRSIHCMHSLCYLHSALLTIIQNSHTGSCKCNICDCFIDANSFRTGSNGDWKNGGLCTTQNDRECFTILIKLVWQNWDSHTAYVVASTKGNISGCTRVIWTICEEGVGTCQANWQLNSHIKGFLHLPVAVMSDVLMFKVIVLSNSVPVMAQTVAFPMDSPKVYVDSINKNVVVSLKDGDKLHSMNADYELTLIMYRKQLWTVLQTWQLLVISNIKIWDSGLPSSVICTEALTSVETSNPITLTKNASVSSSAVSSITSIVKQYLLFSLVKVTNSMADT